MLRLIRTHRDYRTLWCARTVSFLGDSLSLVALLLFVADRTGQAVAVAALLVFGHVLPALFGPVAGAVSDRFDLRRIMVGCDLIQAALTTLLALWLPGLPVLLVVVTIRALAAQVFAPASRTAVGALVASPALPGANAALGLGTHGAEAFGPLLAAAGLPALGVRGVLVIDAASFVVSAGLLYLLPPLRREAAPSGQRARWRRELREGLRYLHSAHVARAVLLGTFAVVACNGIDDVALVFLGKHDLGGGDSAVAVLLAAVGLGLLVGYWLLARAAGSSMAALLLGGFAVSSAGNLLTGLSWALAVAFGLQALRGLGIAAMDVGATTLLQRTVPDRLHGRIFGMLSGGTGLAAGVSYWGGSLLLDATTPRTAFLVAGTGGLVAAAVTALALSAGGSSACCVLGERGRRARSVIATLRKQRSVPTASRKLQR